MCESMVESPLWNWATMWSCESQLIFLGCISSSENNIIDLSYDWSWNETMHLKYQIQGLPNFKPYGKTYMSWPHIPVEPKKVELIEADTECWLPEIGGRGNKGDVSQRIHHFGHAGGLGSRDLRNSIVTVTDRPLKIHNSWPPYQRVRMQMNPNMALFLFFSLLIKYTPKREVGRCGSKDTKCQLPSLNDFWYLMVSMVTASNYTVLYIWNLLRG